MNPNEYQQLALTTEADQQVIYHRIVTLGVKAVRLDIGSRGLADDAGEVNGVIKKYIEYGQPLDTAHLLEECGDCLWRICQVLAAADFTLEQCMQANLAKLKVRYEDGYSDEQAAEENRDRAAEKEVMYVRPRPSETATRPRETLIRQTGQGWAEPPEDSPPSFIEYRYKTNPFDVARQVADVYTEGQNRKMAMKFIDEQEARANG